MQPGNAGNRVALLVIVVLLFALFSLIFDNFGTASNARTIAVTLAAVLIAAMGSAILVITGNIDLSIGGMYSVASVTSAQVAVATGSAGLAAVAGLVSGVLMGIINGVLVKLLAISTIIVTVGTMIVFQGLAYLITSGDTVGGLPTGLVAFGRSTIATIPMPVIIAVVIFGLIAYMLTRTKLGLHIYALGGERRAAELSGVKAARLVLGAYMFNGLLIGAVGVLTTARIGIASPDVGTGFEFDVLTAVILGGVAFTGGAGRPLGIVFGIAAIGILNSGVIFAGLQFYYQNIAKGGLLLIALAADQFAQWQTRQRARSAGLKERTANTATQAGGPRRRRETDPTLAGRTPVLRVAGLTKRYGAVEALSAASLDVRPGEVVCLLGDNGAGKSTLVKIISGALVADAGTVELDGQVIDSDSPAAMRGHGLETVYQDLALCPNLSVAHNLNLGSEPTRKWLGFIPSRDDAKAIDIATERLNGLGVKLPSERVLVENLSGGQRQAVAIARALHPGVKVAIFDEPTAALGVHQTAAVLDAIRGAADRGTGVILISHDVETVLAIADRVVVLRLGRVAYEGHVAALTEIDLVRLMAGIELQHAQ